MTEEEKSQGKKAEAKSEKKPASGKDAGAKKSQQGRSWLGPGQVIGFGLIAIAAVWHFGTKQKGGEVLLKPREIRCSFVDESGQGVPNVVVERSIGVSPQALGGSWEKRGESDLAGKLRFVVGGRIVKVFNRQYLWGLYKKSWREGDYVAYRFVKGDAAMPAVLEEHMVALKEAGRVDPNETDFAGKLDPEMIGEDGLIGYSEIRLALVKGRIDPNALPQPDPNAMVSQ